MWCCPGSGCWSWCGGYDFDVDTNVADVFISYLRRKLEREGVPRVIHTVRGIGYVLRSEP